MATMEVNAFPYRHGCLGRQRVRRATALHAAPRRVSKLASWVAIHLPIPVFERLPAHRTARLGAIRDSSGAATVSDQGVCPGCLPNAPLVCSTLSMSCIHVLMKSMKSRTLAAIGLSWLKTA